MDEFKADIWMPLCIGDYLADTSHLSTLHHGAYLLLLMHYWRTGPLPNDPEQLANICKMTPDAWSIAQAVLGKFFSIGEDGMLHQKRADKEIAAALSNRKSAKEKASHAAKIRWGNKCSKHNPSNAPSNSPSNAQAMPVTVTVTKKEQEPFALSEDRSQLKPTVFTLPCTSNHTYGMPDTFYEKLCIAYPGVNVKSELAKMCAWLEANPTKKKTIKGIPRFINSWLAKAQDNQPRGTAVASQTPKTRQWTPITEQSLRGAQ